MKNGPTEDESRDEMSLTTDQLVLCEFTEDDFSSIHEYAIDPDVIRFMEWRPNTEDDTRDFLRRAITEQNRRPRMAYNFATVLGEEDSLIGACDITISNPNNREGFIGYCLNRDHWGKRIRNRGG